MLDNPTGVVKTTTVLLWHIYSRTKHRLKIPDFCSLPILLIMLKFYLTTKKKKDVLRQLPTLSCLSGHWKESILSLENMSTPTLNIVLSKWLEWVT